MRCHEHAELGWICLESHFRPLCLSREACSNVSPILCLILISSLGKLYRSCAIPLALINLVIYSAEKCSDPEERFTRVLQYYLAGWHIKPKGVKKPYVDVIILGRNAQCNIILRYNPVLGEFFRCRYDYPDGSQGFYIAEQGMSLIKVGM